jgi:DNA-binding beta-propeller fold protein YncE
MVIAAYLFGKELLGHSYGILLALVVAVGRWAINFSRLGMYNISTPLFEFLAMGFLLRALRTGHASMYILAGISLGLGFCFYSVFQLFYLFLGFLIVFVVIREGSALQKIWPGLVMCVIAALIVIAPVVKYAVVRPESYFARVRTTSLLHNTDIDGWSNAVLQNLQKHLLMFNLRGDSNGRHNLPGAPMFDSWTAALLVLGSMLVLRRIQQPRYALLPAWLLVMLGGGVLSLDFEAPQSLRAIGAFPAASAIAVLPLYELDRMWQANGGRFYPKVSWFFILAIIVPMSWSNLYTYFVRQASDFAVWNAFSTSETFVAKAIVELDAATIPYVMSLYDGHPTLRFLAHSDRKYKRLETDDALPLKMDPNMGALLLVDADRHTFVEEAKRYYPDALFEDVRAPFGGPATLYKVKLTAADVQSIQGVAATYYAGDEWGGEPVVARKEWEINAQWPDDAPISLPFVVEWHATLLAEQYGPYQFFATGPGLVSVQIGGEVVSIDTEHAVGAQQHGDGKAILLAKGLHAIKVRATGGHGVVQLVWRRPPGITEVIPSQNLYVAPVEPRGLLGRYYANGEWQGSAALARIDPKLNMYFHVPILARPYTVEWSGKLAIPVDGEYHFGIQAIDEAVVAIDGKQVVATQARNQYVEGSVNLSAGWHDINVQYGDRTDHSFISLYWIPPRPYSDGIRQIIPAEFLRPLGSSYERIAVPLLAQIPAVIDSNAIITQGEINTSTLVATGLSSPKGVAITSNGPIFVAEPALGSVKVITSAGAALESLAGVTNAAFVEPFDLAMDAADNLYVLDAGNGTVAVFDKTGALVRRLLEGSTYGQRARGLTVDGEGNIWIAATAMGRVAKFSAAGELLMIIQPPQGQEEWFGSQPADVAVLSDGSVFVADVGVHRLVQYSADGKLLASIDLSTANSLDAAHLSVAENDMIYITDPEQSKVLRIDANTGTVEGWDLTGQFPGAKPVGIATDGKGGVWVTDSSGGRLIHIKTGFDKP